MYVCVWICHTPNRENRVHFCHIDFWTNHVELVWHSVYWQKPTLVCRVSLFSLVRTSVCECECVYRLLLFAALRCGHVYSCVCVFVCVLYVCIGTLNFQLSVSGLLDEYLFDVISTHLPFDSKTISMMARHRNQCEYSINVLLKTINVRWLPEYKVSQYGDSNDNVGSRKTACTAWILSAAK